MPEFHEACGKAPRYWKLTQAQKELAESWPSCKIPLVLAKKHRRGSEDRYERLLEFANLAYVMAARSFKAEENPLGQEGWQPYAYYWTERHMLNAETRCQRKAALLPLASLDAPTLDGDGTIAETVADYREGASAAIEDREVAEKILRALKAKHRAAARLCWMKGLTLKSAGKRLGVSYERVRGLLAEAASRVRRVFSAKPGQDIKEKLAAWRASVPEAKFRRIEKKRLDATRRACADISKAHVALGGITDSGHYVADPANRTVSGPYPSREAAMRTLAPVQRPDGKDTRRAVQWWRMKQGVPYDISPNQARQHVREGWASVVLPAQPRRRVKANT